MTPFSPLPNSTATLSVGTSDVTYQMPDAAQVWIDNRGTTDVLVAWGAAPVDATTDGGFPIPASTSQPITAPNSRAILHLMRQSGASADTVYVTPGGGF